MTRLPTRPFERNLKLARLGVGAGGRMAAHGVANLFRGKQARGAADRVFYAEQAQVLADELGRLKGSVMKAGQMLSLYGQYFLPEEAVAVLSQLQDNTPAVHWKVLGPVLEHALGRDRLAELEVEREALAAASLGQVHRARRRRDGLELCLKIRYPGVAEAIESDVRTLQRLIAVTRLAPRGLRLEPVFDEVREMLHRETDYETERRFTQDYARRLAGDTRYAVPAIVPEYCSDQVLATTFERGLHVRDPQVQALSQERRNGIALAALELFLTELFDWHMVQTDPHFGNYRVRLRPNGSGPDRLVLLDFGATRTFGPGFVAGYAAIVQGALARDREAIIAGATAIGLMQEHFPDAVERAFAEMCELVVEPFRGGVYDWRGSDLPPRVADKIARAALSMYFRVPPREIVFLHRRLAGVFILLATLGAKLDASALLRERLARAKAAA